MDSHLRGGCVFDDAADTGCCVTGGSGPGADQCRAQLAQFTDRAIDVGNVLVEQAQDMLAWCGAAFAHGDDVADLVQAQAEGARLADEPQRGHVVVGVEAVTGIATFSLGEEPFGLIQPDRFSAHAGSLSGLPDRKGLRRRIVCHAFEGTRLDLVLGARFYRCGNRR